MRKGDEKGGRERKKGEGGRGERGKGRCKGEEKG